MGAGSLSKLNREQIERSRLWEKPTPRGRPHRAAPLQTEIVLAQRYGQYRQQYWGVPSSSGGQPVRLQQGAQDWVQRPQ